MRVARLDQASNRCPSDALSSSGTEDLHLIPSACQDVDLASTPFLDDRDEGGDLLWEVLVQVLGLLDRARQKAESPSVDACVLKRTLDTPNSLVVGQRIGYERKSIGPFHQGRANRQAVRQTYPDELCPLKGSNGIVQMLRMKRLESAMDGCSRY